MGFEPFVPPPRPTEKPPVGSREEKVLALAKLLHARGITSSMTDAKRLAEGMVDVEKKVVKQESQCVAAGPALHPDMADSSAHASTHGAFSITFPEPFAHFVAQAAAISHAGTTPVEILPVVAPVAMVFGREQQRPIAEIPHVHPHKQVFFQDAPPLSEARGFKEPGIQVEVAAVRPARTEVTQVEVAESGVAMTHVESTQEQVVVEERVIITDDAPQQPTVVAPEPKREELAKQHGVDLFEFFKKK